MLPQGCFTVMAPTRCSLGLESDIRVSHELRSQLPYYRNRNCCLLGLEEDLNCSKEIIMFYVVCN